MNTPTIALAANNLWFAVRYLPKGARCGTSGTPILDRDTVEFYELSLADDTAGTEEPGYGPLGQYIARYDAAALLDTDRDETGLDLYVGIPDWSIDGPSMAMVRAWLRRQLAQRPIRKVTLTDVWEPHDPVTVPVEDVAATIQCWGECHRVDEFQAALIAGDEKTANEIAWQFGVRYAVAEKG